MLTYLNNSATSYPKPDCVAEAMARALADPPGLTGRGEESGGEDMVSLCRRLLAGFLGVRDPNRLIFCSNATAGLNVAIHGFVQRCGEPVHVVTTTNDHNSVLRPLRTLEQAGRVAVTIVPSDRQGNLSARRIEAALRPDTRLLAVNHLSNVVGTLAPLEELSAVCRARGVTLLVDAAQSAGIFDIDVDATGIDLLAFTGHKYLLGPTGTGGLCIGEGVELDPFKQGGTGVQSDYPLQPPDLPTRHEAGTVNYVGIVGLHAAVSHLQSVGLPAARRRIFALRDRCERLLGSLDGVTLYGPGVEAGEERGPVVSFNVRGHRAGEIGDILRNEYRIIVRAGLHCAPLCHQSIGTAPEGTVRASFSSLSREDGPEILHDAISRILKRRQV